MTIPRHILLALLIVVTASVSAFNEQLTQYVNPFIGTGGHGHVFLGANVPFGFVQLGPTQPNRGWDWCSGYHYSDHIIRGFGHTHMSGTGIGDKGDIALLPMSHLHQDSVVFSHDNESVRPGYYRLQLSDPEVLVELTATERTGMHRYTFSGTGQKLIKLDLRQGIGWDALSACDFHIESQTHITGMRFSRGWAKNQKVYFSAVFSQPVRRVFGDATTLVLEPEDATQPLLVKVGISGVSEAGAQQNRETEIPDWDFDAVVHQADTAWNRELSKVYVETTDTEARTIFYTAMYHSLVAPSVYNDVDGHYRGADGQVHKGNFTPYTTLSLWDTYRAQMPFLTIAHADRMRDMADTFMRIYQEQGKLPVWHFEGNETDCMVGNPGIIVLADLWLKGFVSDREAVYQAMKSSALKKERSLDLFDKYGYIPFDLDTNYETIAKALEYAIADAGIAKLAEQLGYKEDAEHFLWRSKAYQRLFDRQTSFMRGRDSKGNFREPFDPFNTKHRQDDYCEGNAWQYTWLVPHDVEGLVGMFGSKEAFIAKLDSLFVVEGDLGEGASPDVSGLIGQYAHGNEPSHHIIYLYNYVGQPWKAARLLRQTMRTMYKNDVDGLCGNEDVGQMSAWYLMSAMGLYQVEPQGGRLTLGSPLFDRIRIDVGDGKSFTIVAHNNSKENMRVQQIRLNDKPLNDLHIDYATIMKGGKLEFFMTNN